MTRAAAVSIWLGAQACAIGVAAAGVRLWPHHPAPPESIALAELVFTQMTVASLLSPVLFADLAAAGVGLAGVVAFEHLAGLLASTPESAVLRSTALVSLWVGGLAGCATVLRRPAWITATKGAAVFATVGGVCLAYAKCEADAAAGLAPPDVSIYGPILVTITQIAGPAPSPIGWVEAAIPAAAAATAICAKWMAGRRPPSRR